MRAILSERKRDERNVTLARKAIVGDVYYLVIVHMYVYVSVFMDEDHTSIQTTNHNVNYTYT